MLIDTHCHVHSLDYPLKKEDVLERARNVGVKQMICVGTGIEDSKQAIEFSDQNEGVYAAIGIHPGESLLFDDILRDLAKSNEKIVAIGEIGLDYHYGIENKDKQINLFENQLQVAIDFDLPVLFHVRDSFDDFLAVVRNFPNVRGVVHSFSDDLANLKKVLAAEFFVGVNGIATFAKSAEQREVYCHVPIEKMLLETDAPYLTPAPFRGTLNEPAYVSVVADWLAQNRGISKREIEEATTKNAKNLFKI
jgi:hydrolase, TatD family